MNEDLAAFLAISLALGGIACRKPSGSSSGGLSHAETSSQVLKNFQMQDIVNGTKNMVVESVEGRLIDKEQVADIDKPRVTFYKEGKPSSVLTAPQGRVRMENHEVLAWGGVTVVSADSATLTTERLRYDPQKERLISEDAVRIEKPDSIVIGTGLEADTGLTRVRIGRQKVYVKKRKS